MLSTIVTMLYFRPLDFMFFFFGECECGRGREGGRKERERDIQADSPLSTEPVTGLRPTA